VPRLRKERHLASSLPSHDVFLQEKDGTRREMAREHANSQEMENAPSHARVDKLPEAEDDVAKSHFVFNVLRASLSLSLSLPLFLTLLIKT